MNFPAAVIEAPRALRLLTRGYFFWPAVAPLAVATLAPYVSAISGGDDTAHVHKIAVPHEDPYGFMVFTTAGASIHLPHFDLAKTAETELPQ